MLLIFIFSIHSSTITMYFQSSGQTSDSFSVSSLRLNPRSLILMLVSPRDLIVQTITNHTTIFLNYPSHPIIKSGTIKKLKKSSFVYLLNYISTGWLFFLLKYHKSHKGVKLLKRSQLVAAVTTNLLIG